jgi:translation initiation factor eIF-2B subunit alpha
MPRTPNAEDKPPSTEFDIIATYNDLIRDDPSITPPIAAIESLINLLASSPLTTISETLALLSTHSRKLLASQRNPIPLSAGTDLFQRYLISSFQQRPSSLANSDFSTLRHHIIAQSSLFVKNAGTARSKIARHALPFIIKRDASTSTCASTIVTFGYSRVVHAVLAHAAEHSPAQSRSFDVIRVTRAASSSSSSASSLEETSLAKLASLGIPTATIPLHALPYALSSLPTPPQVLLGASAVLENGAIVADLGSHAVGLMAQAFNVPLHVCVESYKFVRNFPLGCGPGDLTRMGVRQDVLKFSDPASDAASDVGDGDGVHERKGDDYFASEGNSASAIPEAEADGEGEEEGYGPHEDPMIEITPPELISALITENGIMTPHAVSEELIKLWF